MSLTHADKAVVAISLFVIVILYGVLWQSDDEAQKVEVIVSGEKTHILDLHQDQQITVNGKIGESIIEIKSGRARFVSSTCHTHFCIRSGWQNHGGDFVACLPNGVSLHLAGGQRVYDAINF